MRSMRPLHSLHPMPAPHASRRGGRSPGKHLGFEALEFRTLLATPAGVTPSAFAPEIRSAAGDQPAGWTTHTSPLDKARFVLTCGAPLVTVARAHLTACLPSWPPAPQPPRWHRQTDCEGHVPRPHQPRSLPRPATAALVWPPRASAPAPRPLRVPTPRFEILAPRPSGVPPVTVAWRPAPRAGGDGDRVARVAVYSSASFHGLRGPHLRFRNRVTLPHEGR
jgi:hypothetical protein